MGSRNVTLSPFYIGRFQVTQGEWYAVMGARRGWFDGTNRMSSLGTSQSATPEFDWRDLPVEQVGMNGLNGIIVFANRLSMARRLTPAYEIPDAWPDYTSWSSDPAHWGTMPTISSVRWNNVRMIPGSTGYRLPTAAQWEFAARGGNHNETYQFSGGNIAREVAWFVENSNQRTHPVGQLRPNALGLYDMSGNVSEGVWNVGALSGDVTDPQDPQSNRTGRRGGNWTSLIVPGGGELNPTVPGGGALSGTFGFRLAHPMVE